MELPTQSETLQESEALQAAREQRRGVLAALVALEAAAATPAAGDSSWIPALVERLEALRAAFAHHIEVTEGDDGLFEEIVDNAPRLAHRTDTLRSEHLTIAASIEHALDAVSNGLAADDLTAVNDVQLRVADVISAVTHHRMLGASLVHEAYNVDLAGGE